MFNRDTWIEILHSLGRNKLRTALTMFGVFWGIFMLMLLMGASTGLQNGVMDDFAGEAYSTVYMWTQRTTMPYKGMLPNRGYNFNLDDMEAIRSQVPTIEALSPQNQLGGYRGGNNVVRNNKSGAFSIMGVFPDLKKITYLKIDQGRFVNQADIQQKRKVAVIGTRVRDMLFKPNENPIGDYIKIQGVYFQIIGVRSSIRTGDRASEETETVFIPFSAFQQAFNRGNLVGWFAFTPKKGFSAQDVEKQIRLVICSRHQINPQDLNAIGSWNTEKQFNKMNGLFVSIKVFNWVVGLGTLLAGLIGVSNIMLISVNDRTREIGIRKSLGATPAKVIGLILQESLFITLIAGYIGLFLGFSIMEAVQYVLKQSPQPPDMFNRPEIDIQNALLSLAVLVVGGLLAGVIPARKAASIQPVEALRAE